MNLWGYFWMLYSFHFGFWRGIQRKSIHLEILFFHQQESNLRSCVHMRQAFYFWAIYLAHVDVAIQILIGGLLCWGDYSLGFCFCLCFQIAFYQSVLLTGLEPANTKHTDLKLPVILLPLPLKFLDYRHPTPAQINLFTLFIIYLLYFWFFKNLQDLM